MKRSSYTSIFAWGIAALVCLFILAVPAHAASLAEQTGFRMGPGDHYDEAVCFNRYRKLYETVVSEQKENWREVMEEA